MVRWFLASILAGALISITGLAGAGAQQPDQVRITAVDNQAYPRLRTSVTVLDESGRPVAGLDSEAFKVAADGKPVRVSGFTTGQDPNVPAAVVLAFDTSGSMDGTPIEQARQAGKALAGQLGPTDQVAVLTFSNTVQLAQDFTSDRGALVTAIDRIAAAGNTALYGLVGVRAGPDDPASTRTLRVEVNHAGTVSAGETPLDLSPFAPSPVATPVTPPTTQAATAVATPAGTGSEGGSSAFPLAVAGGLVVLGLGGAGGVVYWLRRRRWPVPQGLWATWPPPPGGPRARFGGTGPLGNFRAEAWLESVAPENAGRFPLGEDPVTVGFTGDCTICLPNGAGYVGARFRVWRREPVYMLHNLSRLGKVTVGGKPATWAVLEDGDEIVIGASRLRFHIGSQNSVA